MVAGRVLFRANFEMYPGSWRDDRRGRTAAGAAATCWGTGSGRNLYVDWVLYDLVCGKDGGEEGNDGFVLKFENK